MANPLRKKILRISKPARYVGGEYGARCGAWDAADLRWLLAFPDVYEIGMSHLGIQILYHILNDQEGVIADRAFAPWADMEELLKSENQPLWGLETGRAVSEFDIIGISIPYELTYTNILSILKLGGVPLLSSERGDGSPIVIGGGCGAFNPEPIAPFFDAILLGDGETAVLEISSVVKDAKRARLSRAETIEMIGKIEGVYIPSHGKSRKIKKQTVTDLDSASFPVRPIVPNLKLVHDRSGIEIQRGCTHGCRFCQAGIVYRPVRQRGKSNILELADKSVGSSGYEECSLLSLSAGDHDLLAEIIVDLGKNFGRKWVHLSLPSLRTETLNAEVVGALSRSLQGGFTLAPEAATDRLRQVINKGNSGEDLLASIDKVFKVGWRNIKLYFMIGLPTEKDEDIDAIATLARGALTIGRRYHRYPNVTVNVSTFVPKSHTPFQWEEQISFERTGEIQRRLKDKLRGAGLNIKLHSPKVTFLEGVFARGGRELSKAILLAYEKGRRFDAWDDVSDFDQWMEVFRELEIDPQKYLAARDLKEELPWDHLYAELDKKFLIEERDKSRSGDPTDDCSRGPCVACGICDFDRVQPVIARSPSPRDDEAIPREHLNTGDCFSRHSGIAMTHSGSHRYKITYSKTGEAVYIGHLDLMNVWRRALRRAELPLKYSEGYNPRPKLSFPDPLSLGVASELEFFEFELTREYGCNIMMEALKNLLPAGLKLIDVSSVDANLSLRANRVSAAISRYHLNTGDCFSRHSGIAMTLSDRINEFLASDKIPFEKKGQKGLRTVDLKEHVHKLAQISDRAIEVTLGGAGLSILDFVSWFFGVTIDKAREFEILKLNGEG